MKFKHPKIRTIQITIVADDYDLLAKRKGKKHSWLDMLRKGCDV